MAAPATCEQFLDLVRKSGLLEESTLNRGLASLTPAPDAPAALAAALVQGGLLTRFQGEQLKAGKSRGFVIGGKYKLLEFLGAGGMGRVYLCEHTDMRRRVALKVLPAELGKDGSYMERFYREARAVARLDHPNIVRAHDIDHDSNVHFLVMEYVDGASLQAIVDRRGPLDPSRAAHYLSQAAWGLQHAHEAGLVHRDVKPGNVLLDRQGTVKLLDLGLARFFHEDDGLSKKFDENVLGTTDYLAPEQVIDGKVDIRADIYALGATFYYVLTGQTLFGAGRTAAKLVWQQVRKPRPIREHRPEVPADLAALIEEQMLAKEPERRFQTPADICAALEPWTQDPIPPPPAEEMPVLCPALCVEGQGSQPRTPPPSRSAVRSSASKRCWTIGGNGVKKGPPPAVPAAAELDTEPARAKDTPRESRKARAHSEAPPSPAPTPRPGPRPASSRTARARRWALMLGLGAFTCVVLAGTIASVGWAIMSVMRDTATEPPVAPPVLGGARPTGLPTGGLTLAADPAGHRVRTPSYEALVGTDGNLSSFRVGGVELLKNGIRFGPNVARGSYFFYTEENGPGIVKLPTIQRPTAHTLKAIGDRFTVQYEFGADSIAMKLTNATDHRVPFYIILDRAVSTVSNEQGEAASLPAVRDWPTTTWFAGRARLDITGGTKIWGPWPTAADGYQVWEASLATYETRQVTLTVGTASEAETARLATAVVSGAPRRIDMPAYEAIVEADGCLTSLRVHGTELLRPGPDVSRGFYLHNGKGVVYLPEIDQPQKEIITAKGAEASIRYEFAADSLTCTVANKTKAALACYIVFDSGVVAMRDGGGEWAKLPVAGQAGGPLEPRLATTTWFAARARLQVTGGSRVWGPFSPEQLQVWEASLAPEETRKIVLHMGKLSDEENAKLAAVAGHTFPHLDIAVQSPRRFQVFQRQSRLEGPVHLRGRVHVPCDALQARLSGESLQGPLPDRWHEIPLSGPERTFDHLLRTGAGGWYTLELRALKGGKEVATTSADHFGVGEVFIAAGQSNSTNCSPDKLEQTSGKVATFDGYQWRPGHDPQPGVHDRTMGGSCWPAFGDAMVARYRVPVGIASAGHSGTSVNQWQPGGELFKWMMTRAHQLGPQGFRGVLWHQGESDVGVSADDYATRLGDVIRGSHKAAGWDCPWFVARVSYHNPQNTSFPSTRDGQKKLCDTGVALEGPDTDMLTGDNRSEGGQGIHFSAKGCRAHGRLWAEKVGVYLDRVLEK